MSLMKKMKLSKITYLEYRDELFFVVALAPLLLVACLFYGLRPLTLSMVTVATAYLVDYLCTRMRKRQFVYNDMKCLHIGLSLTLLMPATVPYWVLMIGAFFAVAVVKHVFGGTENHMFNPVGTAFCFLAVSWPQYVFFYPRARETLDIFSNIFPNLVQAPSFALKGSGVPYLTVSELFLGNYPGIMGGTATLVVVACGIFLFSKKQISWHIPVTFLSTYTLLVFLFPRIITNSFDSVIYEVFSTPMVYLSIFVISDKKTTPVKEESQIFFGVILGFLTLLYSYISPMENVLLFTLMIATALSSYLDRIFTPLVLHFGRVEYPVYKKKLLDYLQEKIQVVLEEKPKNTSVLQEKIKQMEQRNQGLSQKKVEMSFQKQEKKRKESLEKISSFGLPQEKETAQQWTEGEEGSVVALKEKELPKYQGEDKQNQHIQKKKTKQHNNVKSNGNGNGSGSGKSNGKGSGNGNGNAKANGNHGKSQYGQNNKKKKKKKKKK